MRFTHVRLVVDDVASCVAFYRDVLGFTVRSDFGGYVELDTEGVALSLFDRSTQAETVELRPAGDGALLGVDAHGVADAVERLRAHVIAGPIDRPDWGLRVAYLRDPAGNLIELNENIPHAE